MLRKLIGGEEGRVKLRARGASAALDVLLAFAPYATGAEQAQLAFARTVWGAGVRENAKVKCCSRRKRQMAAGSNDKADGKKSVVVWFRKALRIHDNLALKNAVSKARAEELDLLPIFTLDPHFLSPEKVGAKRLQFLLESLHDVDKSLRQHGSRLLLLRGTPETVIPDLVTEHRAVAVYFEKDHEPYAKVRDALIRELVEKKGAAVHAEHGHTLHDLDMLLGNCAGQQPPTTMPAFLKLMDDVGEPRNPLSAEEVVGSGSGKNAKLPQMAADLLESDKYDIPADTLSEEFCKLGYSDAYPDSARKVFVGGENEALQRLDSFCARGNGRAVREFSKPHTSPAAFNPPSTTTLSPYLKFGCISPRTVYAAIRKAAGKSQKTKPPMSLLGQLYWREHFMLLGYAVGADFGHMRGNDICRQISWDESDEKARNLTAWEQGQTGYPWIDACMRQLVQEGWLHHLARHAVACFLTRGDLWISWEEGVRVFERELVDADWALNSANWMWLSCSAFFHQYFRVYSPVSFPKKYDKDGTFVRRYVPELKKFPEKYIYEPWKAPLAEQKRAGCVIGKDYPKPIVDHSDASKANIERMKKAFEQNKRTSHENSEAAADTKRKRAKS